MALPGNVAASTSNYAPFQGGRALVTSLSVDYETGGIALNDPSQGHLVQIWTTVISEDGTQILTSAPSAASSIIFTGTAITEVSLSFDQNMRPVIAFVDSGVAKLDWYNTLIAARETLVLGAGVTNPKVSLDDKRPRFTGTSDVLLLYIRDGNIYYKQQRDRFLTERLLSAGVSGVLLRAGMNSINRFQWETTERDLEATPTVEDALATAPSITEINTEVPDTEATASTFDLGSSTLWESDNEDSV